MISIIGLGVTGSAIQKSFINKQIKQKNYDKYKNIGKLEDCLNSVIIFLCLPTPFNKENNEYNKDPIYDVLDKLEYYKYDGVIVLKSTVEPNTTNELYDKYKLKHHFNLVHNPEFLSSSTAYEDFHNQSHIVLGRHKECYLDQFKKVKSFYKKYYSNSEISICFSNESESMKIFLNSFYASKIQLFNEYYLLCKKTGINYENVKRLMLKNNWINPMHTNVPGKDNKLSYGGDCFPKDTKALNAYMKKNNASNKVLDSVIKEHDELRGDE